MSLIRDEDFLHRGCGLSCTAERYKQDGVFGGSVPGPTSRPFLKAFVCAAVAFAAPIIAVLIAWGPPKNKDAYYLLEDLTQLFLLAAVPAMITGFLARRAKTAWSNAKIAVVYVLVFILFVILTIAGKMRPAAPPAS